MYRVNPDLLGLEKYFVTSSGVLSLCESPDHDDNNPSMFINLSEGFCYCYSCGFTCSIQKLVELTGGEIKYTYQKQKNTAKDNAWVKKLGYNLGYDDKYLANRGVTNEQVALFDIRSNKDEVVFPMRNLNGETIGVKVRLKRPVGKVKYLTFGETPTYYSNTTLNNTNKPVVVTEGIFGVLRYDKFGVNALSPLSVTRIEPLQKVFEKYSEVDFVLRFDPDIAGYTATMKLLFLCRILPNVYSDQRLYDIDELSDLIIKGQQNVHDDFKVKDPFYYFKTIKHYWGEDIKEDVKRRVMKFIEDNV